MQNNPFGARHLRVVRSAGDADPGTALNAPPDPPDGFVRTGPTLTITDLPTPPIGGSIEIVAQGREPYWAPVAWSDSDPTGELRGAAHPAVFVAYDPAQRAAWLSAPRAQINIDILVRASSCTLQHRAGPVDLQTDATLVASALPLTDPGDGACTDATRPHRIVRQLADATPAPYKTIVDTIVMDSVSDGGTPASKSDGLLWVAVIALGLGGLWFVSRE